MINDNSKFLNIKTQYYLSLFLFLFFSISSFSILFYNYYKQTFNTSSFSFSIVFLIFAIISFCYFLSTNHIEKKKINDDFSEKESKFEFAILDLINHLTRFVDKKDFSKMLPVDDSILGNVSDHINQILYYLNQVLTNLKSENNDLLIKSKKINLEVLSLNKEILNQTNKVYLLPKHINKINLINEKSKKIIFDLENEQEKLSVEFNKLITNIKSDYKNIEQLLSKNQNYNNKSQNNELTNSNTYDFVHSHIQNSINFELIEFSNNLKNIGEHISLIIENKNTNMFSIKSIQTKFNGLINNVDSLKQSIYFLTQKENYNLNEINENNNIIQENHNNELNFNYDLNLVIRHLDNIFKGLSILSNTHQNSDEITNELKQLTFEIENVTELLQNKSQIIEKQSSDLEDCSNTLTQYLIEIKT